MTVHLLAVMLVVGPLQQDTAGARILANVDAVMSGVEDFTVRLNVVANIERLSVPPMEVTMFYKRPDKIHFDAKGFALIPKEGIGATLGKLAERFTAREAVWDTLHGRSVYRLVLEPRSEKAKVRTMTLYVDPVRWTAERAVSASTDGRSITATFTYASFDNFWLPTALTVTFVAPSSGGPEPDLFGSEQSPAPRRQMPRSGTVEIRYSDYRINTGLAEEIFLKKNSP